MRSSVIWYRRSKIALAEINRGQCLQKIKRQPGSVEGLDEPGDHQCGGGPTASFSYFLQ